MDTIELQNRVWDLTPSFRRTLSHGKRLIVLGSSTGRFGETATEWSDIGIMDEAQLKSIINSYEGK